jgi:hypothetical protein
MVSRGADDLELLAQPGPVSTGNDLDRRLNRSVDHQHLAVEDGPTIVAGSLCGGHVNRHRDLALFGAPEANEGLAILDEHVGELDRGVPGAG